MTARRGAPRARIVATGKQRSQGGGSRAWRTRLYAPTEAYTQWRVTYKAPRPGGTDGDPWVWTSKARASEEAARAVFRQVEEALDAALPMPVDHRTARRNTMARLAELYLTDCRDHRKLAARTLETRASILRTHVIPVVGELAAADWRPKHSDLVLAEAGGTCGHDHGPKHRTVGLARLQDVRKVLSGLRRVAWREGWLPRTVDPLDEVSVAAPQRLHGAAAGYVMPSARPTRAQVDAAAEVADRLGPQWRMPAWGTMCRLAGYGGLRLGEQRGLRPWDLEGEVREDGSVRWIVYVNGSWTQLRAVDGVPFRGPVKNKTLHHVPLPGTVMGDLVVLAKSVLGHPEWTDRKLLSEVNTERHRRGRLMKDPQAWHRWSPAATTEEAWLFVDTATGLPPRSEHHTWIWQKVMRELRGTAAEWPPGVPYRNLRHAAVGYWRSLDPPASWETVAAFLGDRLPTVLGYYVRPTADAVTATADLLAGQ